MVMNYDTYLEIDQDSDSGIPGKPVWTHKKRRHDEKIPSQKIDWQFIVRPRVSSNMMGESLSSCLHVDDAITG